MPTHVFLESTILLNAKYYIFNAETMRNTEKHNEKQKCHHAMIIIMFLDTDISGITFKYVSLHHPYIHTYTFLSFTKDSFNCEYNLFACLFIFG